MNSHNIKLVFFLNQILDKIFPSELIKLIGTITYVPIKVAIGIHQVILYNDSDQIVVLDQEDKLTQYTFPNIKKIVSGFSMYYALTFDGCVYDLTDSNHNANLNNPRRIEGLGKITDIVCGGSFTMVLDTNNDIYGWGVNTANILGTSSTDETHPVKYNLLNKKVKQISAGFQHVIVLTDTNEIYGWGDNNKGQLCLGHTKNVELPQRIQLDSVTRVECGYKTSALLTAKGEIYLAGEINYGYEQSPIKYFILNKLFTSVTCGYYNIIAKTSNNEFYQLNKSGQVKNLHQAKLITTGYRYVISITQQDIVRIIREDISVCIIDVNKQIV